VWGGGGEDGPQGKGGGLGGGGTGDKLRLDVLELAARRSSRHSARCMPWGTSPSDESPRGSTGGGHKLCIAVIELAAKEIKQAQGHGGQALLVSHDSDGAGGGVCCGGLACRGVGEGDAARRLFA
jgi:hypothetical protein